jgi:hypothetical protein
MVGVSGIREEEGKTCMPEAMRPKIVCFPSSHAVGPSVMKNCSHAASPVFV